MAKGNLFLGQAKGKVGSVVFSRAFGQQITRTKPTSVKNPKTIGQNTQRAILATIAKEAALLTPIVDHSWANVAYGAESVRHFRKVNMGILRNMLLSSVGTNYNLSAKGAGAVPNALKISEGNLPAFSAAYQSHVLGFYMGSALSAISEVEVSDFKSAYPYIQGGDQLTLVKLVKTSGSLVDGDAVFALKCDRVVFATNAFDDPDQLVITDEGFLNTEILDMTKTTSETAIKGVNAGGGNAIGCSTDTDNTYAAALILSRKVNNVWQRSSQSLTLTEFDDSTDNQGAIESYGASASLSEATEYLNQAEEGESDAGLNDSYMQMVAFRDGVSSGNWSIYPGEISTGELTLPAGETIGIKINGYAAGLDRVVACEIVGPDNTSLATGTTSASWQKTMAAGLAGVYKCYVVYGPNYRAEFDLTVALQS